MSHFFCAFVFRETHNVDDAPRGRQKPPLVRVARRRDRLLLPGEARAPPDRADDAVEKSGSSIGGKDLSPKKKLNYASNDVRYLIQLYSVILEKLKQKKVCGNINKYHSKLLDKKNYLKKPGLAWQKIKINNKEDHKFNLLKEICRRREQTAKTKNIPAKRLIKDQEIKYISKKKTNYSDILKTINSIKNKQFKEELKKIVIEYNN